MSTLAVNTITNAAGGNTAQINGMTPTAQSLQGFRNRIINGNMVIDQRNNGAAVTLASEGANGYAADRWYTESYTNGSATIQQVSDAPTGFTSSLRYTVTGTDTSLASDQAAFIQHRVEGFNSADLSFGTASASSVTISFWVKSSVTGTFGGALANSAYNRGYPFAYTISAANTWEQKTVTIAGDTTGTWVGATNGIGLRLTFAVAAGSARASTAGAWAAYVGIGATGQVNLMATNGATFHITGVQLETGAVATPFERRPFGAELALCQRYAVVYGGSTFERLGGTSSYSFIQSACITFLPVPMRTTPSMSVTGSWQDELPGIASQGITSFSLDATGSSPRLVKFDVTHASNAAFGSSRAGQVTAANDANARFSLTAEL